MGIDVSVCDGERRLKINGEGEITVSMHTHPPIDEEVEALPFRSYFENAGSNDMRVNGATTSVDFSIDADQDFDYFIKSLHVKLADPGAKLDKFGALNALTNGVSYLWKSNKDGELTIHEGIKDNMEFFRLSDQYPQIIDLSGGGADAVIIAIDLAKLFGNPWGIRLVRSSEDKLIIRINDDLSTGLVEFNVIGYGVKV